ncbi:C4-dicarboxylate ABC transporter [Ruegeria marisrubri]|uniref:TRAP transporter large permease protein n=1 Tax=Ruegeria marisrubri TaxID=1685379 RepID=A0A0X3UBM0_9RHOB|nr:TRAP transporter large permease subunit [Ruegeria marisrubri]KUJ85259.1 C4-dicarboxylate ABC transporter [Ruegeria marisrubri]
MTLALNDYMSILMLVAFVTLIFTGFPVAWTLAGLAMVFTLMSVLISSYTTWLDDSWYVIDWAFLTSLTDRNWAVMESWVLVALPMFIFMGLFLDKSGVARELMENFSRLLGRVKGGLAVSVAIIGILLAASTGIIGASVVLLTLLGVPVMLEAGYNKSFAVGTACAVGTLGILIPPSIMLLLVADRMAISVGDLFMGAVLPGLMLGLLYVVFLLVWARLRPGAAPSMDHVEPMDLKAVLGVVWAMLPPILLIFAVLGSIFFGIATPTEASGVGAAATALLAFIKGRFSWSVLKEVSIDTTKTTGFIFAIVMGATAFSLVFRGLGGDDLVKSVLNGLPLSTSGIVIMILFVTFVLGFFLDWLEITLIILPMVAPALADLGVDLVWFAILFAVCLQTSFITPPVGPALFYAQGVVPREITLRHIYRGVIPFVILQLIALALVFNIPALATWLPSVSY